MNRKEVITDLIKEAREFRFSLSDDSDEITAMTASYRGLVIKFKRLVAPILGR